MTSSGYADGTREIVINVINIHKEITSLALRVNGDLHIGGLMKKIVDHMQEPSTDWSDYGIWWPDKNIWLTRTRSTLDQLEVHSDAKLVFTTMHKSLTLVLPDLQRLDMRVNFALNVFGVVIKLCKEFGIRHPEELSILRKLEQDELKKNKGISATRRTKVPYASTGGKQQPPDSGSKSANVTFDGSSTSSGYGSMDPVPSVSFNANGLSTCASMQSLSFSDPPDCNLFNTPSIQFTAAFNLLCRPKNFAEKARINCGWLDSSRSLMEQGIHENDVILLRYKFPTFFELLPKYDQARINEIYEQVRWSLISEQIDCTAEEMVTFAALQLQIENQVNEQQPDLCGSPGVDNLDSALDDLQMALEGTDPGNSGSITRVPELSDYLLFYKPKSFGLKRYKPGFAVYRETDLSIFASEEDKKNHQEPIFQANLKECQVATDTNVSMQRFSVKLRLPSNDGDNNELLLRLLNDDSFAKWSIACRLASKGKTMADRSYDMEVSSIKSILQLQRPSNHDVADVDFNFKTFRPEQYMSTKCLKHMKNNINQITRQLKDRHANVKHMNLMEAKLNYIKAWQTLEESSKVYFIVKFKNNKKEELLSVSKDGINRMDLQTGNILKTWRSDSMQTWAVNWDIKQVQVSFENEHIAFQCLTADCKVVHEFIGGFIFLSMRSGDRSQVLNEELFHQLTGGWD